MADEHSHNDKDIAVDETRQLGVVWGGVVFSKIINIKKNGFNSCLAVLLYRYDISCFRNYNLSS